MMGLHFFLVLALALPTLAGALSSESVNADGSSGALASAESPAEALATRRFDILMAHSSAQFSALTAERASDRAESAAVRASDRAQSAAERASDRAESAAQFSAQAAEFASFRAEDAAHKSLFEESLSELLGSTQTPRSAAAVDACARRSVLHITYPTVNKTHPLEKSTERGICSAFAYQPDPSKAAMIVTAAHCFIGLVPGGDITLMRLGDSFNRSCSVLHTFSSPEDAALLSCTNVSSIPGLAPSAGTRLSQLVAITGFASDAFSYSQPRSHHFLGAFIALNVDFARIASVAGPASSNGSACSSTDPAMWQIYPSGFVDRRIPSGMSGCPVLDLQCGVVGIAHGRSCDGGVFMSLAVIDAFLSTIS